MESSCNRVHRTGCRWGQPEQIHRAAPVSAPHFCRQMTPKQPTHDLLQYSHCLQQAGSFVYVDCKRVRRKRRLLGDLPAGLVLPCASVVIFPLGVRCGLRVTSELCSGEASHRGSWHAGHHATRQAKCCEVAVKASCGPGKCSDPLIAELFLHKKWK